MGSLCPSTEWNRPLNVLLTFGQFMDVLVLELIAIRLIMTLSLLSTEAAASSFAQLPPWVLGCVRNGNFTTRATFSLPVLAHTKAAIKKAMGVSLPGAP